MGNGLAINSVLYTPENKKWLALAVANHLSDRVSTSQGTDESLYHRYAVKELPQPQFRAALGFWNTNPWRINVSSYSSIVPLRYNKLFGSTKMRAPNSSKTLSRSRDWVSSRMA